MLFQFLNALTTQRASVRDGRGRGHRIYFSKGQSFAKIQIEARGAPAKMAGQGARAGGPNYQLYKTVEQ